MNTAYMTQKIFFALGTVCTLTVYDGNVNEALSRSRERVMEIHRRMNAYDPDSEVSRINATAGREYVKVSEDTFYLIDRSVYYSRFTGGRYDITTRSSSLLWKKAIAAKTLPEREAITEAAALTDYRDILLDREHQRVMLRRRGQQLDLGAIAKGYAADEVCRILIEEGVTEAVINLGGTVYTIGSSRRIGIQNPFEKTGTSFAYIDVEDRAVVTSGLYEQGFTAGGRTYHHIVDPATGYPSDTALAGVTLIGDCAEALDALSTTVFMMQTLDAKRLLRRMRIEAIFVTKTGNVFTTDGLKQSYAHAG